ncbi:hypothetical protein OPV22_007310 [Ensete ventricosum]|uniref:Dof zinc finger protein n=1 Tax=Ensete ventricosum TaxID=4639 RepID=A0AAV8RQ02_ENSVE|nr:hypothetical protein OPV22_007310 [Ensete ventricosum]
MFESFMPASWFPLHEGPPIVGSILMLLVAAPSRAALSFFSSWLSLVVWCSALFLWPARKPGGYQRPSVAQQGEKTDDVIFLLGLDVSSLKCQASAAGIPLLSIASSSSSSSVEVCMDTPRWRPQAVGLVDPMLQEFASSTDKSDTCTTTRPQTAERRPRPHKEQALGCPRCNSTNTKFCYYNNYSLAQPRYYCRSCRRYWTEGGSLRNVPVGGGSRKNKRYSPTTAAAANSSSSASVEAVLATVSTSKTSHADRVPPSIWLSTSSEAPKFHEGHDRNLAFRQHGLPEHSDFPTLESSSGRAAVGAHTAIELLLVPNARGSGPFMPMPMPLSDYSTGFGLKEFRPPTIGFPYGISGGSSGGYESLRRVQESDDGKLLLPFEDLRPVVHPNNVADRGPTAGDPPRFWNGIIGGGGSW